MEYNRQVDRIIVGEIEHRRCLTLKKNSSIKITFRASETQAFPVLANHPAAYYSIDFVDSIAASCGELDPKRS
jgi:hypothetical protein